VFSSCWLCPDACDARSLWWTCRAGQLCAALHLYQQAAGVTPEEDGKQAGTSCAEAVAEASLKLAFLCNDLLQVGIAQPENRVHDTNHIACNVVLDATGTVSGCKMMHGIVWLFACMLSCLSFADEKNISGSKTAMKTIPHHLMLKSYTEIQRPAWTEGFVLAGMQSEDDASSSIASQLTQAAAEAVKKSDGGLEAMLVRHMMHAMQLGGPSGTISLTSTPHDHFSYMLLLLEMNQLLSCLTDTDAIPISKVRNLIHQLEQPSL